MTAAQIRRPLLLNLLLFVVLITQDPVTAQESTLTSERIRKMTLEEMMNIQIISASRQTQSLIEAAANVVVVTAGMIEERGYLTLAEVLEDLPGFDFTTHQPAGEYPSHIVFRGIADVGQPNMLIMIDGIVRNDVANGWARNLGYNFILSDIERIEVVYGPGSTLFGANAYAGLIHVITKEFERYTNTNGYLRVATTVGPNNTLAPGFNVGYRLASGLEFQLSGRWYRTDGDGGRDRPDPGGYFHGNFEPDSVLTTEYGNISNERNTDGSRKRILEGFDTSVDDLYVRGRIRKDGFTAGFSIWNRNEGLGSQVNGYEYFANTPGLDYLAHHTGNTVYTSYEFDLSPRITAKTLLYYRNTNILPETGFYYTYKFQSVDNDVDPIVVDKKKAYGGKGFAGRYEQQVNIKFSDRNNVVLGFHVERVTEQHFGISLGEKQASSSTVVGSTYDSEERTVQPMFFSRNFALFAQDEYNFGSGYKITGGLRYDDDGRYGAVMNSRLALVANYRSGVNLRLLYGEAYRAPTVFELFDEWRGNGNLKPQEISTFEMLLTYSISELLSVRGNLFYSDLGNLIVEAPNPNPVTVPIGPNGEHATYFQNIGRSSIRGLMLSGHLRPIDDLSLSANYTMTLGDNNDEIDNIARHKANLIVSFIAFNRINMNVRANIRGKVKAPVTNRYFYPKTSQSITEVGYDYVTEDAPDGYMDGFALVNLTLTGKQLLDRRGKIEPQLIIRNLFDVDYMGIGRQSGSSVRPVSAIQPTIQNPIGFIPAYHPQPGREILLRIIYRP